MSVSEVTKLLSQIDIHDASWLHDLQAGLTASGFKRNHDNCVANNTGRAYSHMDFEGEVRTDGSWGPNTRRDLVNFLQKNDTAILSLSTQLKEYLLNKGWSRQLQSVVSASPDVKQQLCAEIEMEIAYHLGSDVNPDELTRQQFNSLPLDVRKELQSNWKLLGKYTGRIDGLYGPKTAHAIKNHPSSGCMPTDKPESNSEAIGPSAVRTHFNHESIKAQQRAELSASIRKTARHYEGTRYVWDGKDENGIDCSEFVLRAIEGTTKDTDLIDEQYAESCGDMAYAAGITRCLHKQYDLPMNHTRHLSVDDLEAGMVISIDVGYKEYSQEYYKKIDHIAVTFRDENGQLMVAESTTDRVNLTTGKRDRNGTSGMIITPADKFVERFNGRSNFYVIDLMDAVETDQVSPQFAQSTTYTPTVTR